MAENTMLLLTEKHISWGAEKIDELIKGNIFVETADGIMAKFGLIQLNKLASPYIPDEYKPAIQIVLDDVIEENYPEALEDASEELTRIIEKFENIKPIYKEIATGLINIIQGVVIYLIEKKNKE
mgnify:CR=1 FL=1